ncbi:MAG: RNA polymerase sigma factor [Gemmataceae bacterium]|nr:RNA polymerase sigma factor [Gemmataceae bacterium]
MSSGTLAVVVQHLRRLTEPRRPEPTDRALLERFVQRHDESAFGLLVQRHGPMVLGVCRRLLRHEQDAEDAFQATFLTLARKAASVRWHDSIANWLHGVARRLALKQRGRAARRRALEQQLTHARPTSSASALTWDELQPLLDEELERLPARYREPLVLCYLEGLTRDEAAGRLGWTTGAVKGALERGRELLRQRLGRRGVALSAALGACSLGGGATVAAVAPALAGIVTTAAGRLLAGQAVAGLVRVNVLTLREGGLPAMFLTKLKTLTVLFLALGVLGVGGAALTHQALADRPALAQADPAPAGQRRDDKPVPKEKQAEKPAPREKEKGDEKRRDGERPAATGILKALDVARGTLTLTILRDGGRQDEQTYRLAKDVQVILATREPGKLNDLRVGMTISLTLARESRQVVLIRVGRQPRAPVIAAEIQSVDSAKKRLTVAVRTEAGMREQTFELAGDVRVQLGRAENAKLADLAKGMRVVLTLTPDRKTVVAIRSADREGDGKDRPGPRDGEGVRGIVGSVDAARGIIQLKVGDDQARTLSFEVARNARLMSDLSESIKLADIKPGLLAAVTLAPDRKQAVVVRAFNPLIEATVEAIDLAKGTITLVRGEKKGGWTLAVAKDVRLGERGQVRPGELIAGVRVRLTLSLDGGTVQRIQLLNREGDKE